MTLKCRNFLLNFPFLATFVFVSMGFNHPSFAVPIPFTVNLSETVVVTGTPRLQLDIGGVTRYASYNSGTGSNALTFSYPVVAPDFDRNGITLVSPLDLNGGTILDLSGNNANLTFTLPNTAGVLVQSYTVAWTTSPINASNETAVSFNILNAPITATTYNYTITSSGGGGSVVGSGSVTANPQAVTGVNVSNLPDGTLTLSVTVTNATGTGNAKTSTVSGAFTGILDTLPPSAAAYSIRRLRSGYTGPLMRVRRSSDSTEQDIGHTLGGNLNTATLTTFCGANSCFVRTWYDQSGNVRNATQTTAVNQPRIVNAGTIDLQNSRPTQRFATSSFDFNGVPLANTNYTFNGIIARNSAGSTNYWLAGITQTGTNTLPHIGWRNNSNYTHAQYSNDYDIGVSVYTATTLLLATHTASTTGGKNTFFNGTLAGSSVNTVNLLTYSSATIGRYQSNYFSGVISEVTLFPSALVTIDRQTLENNQKTYFSIP